MALTTVIGATDYLWRLIMDPYTRMALALFAAYHAWRFFNSVVDRFSLRNDHAISGELDDDECADEIGFHAIYDVRCHNVRPTTLGTDADRAASWYC